MKPIGAFRKTRLIALNGLRLCLLFCLSAIHWPLLLLGNLLIAISCLTLQCATEVSALLSNNAAVSWRLLIVTSRTSRRLRSKKMAANTFGT